MDFGSGQSPLKPRLPYIPGKTGGGNLDASKTRARQLRKEIQFLEWQKPTKPWSLSDFKK